jgi:DNA polymerase I
MKVYYIDTETSGLDPRTDKVRLVQIYDGTNMRIVDAWEHPEILDELLAMVEDSKSTKVFHNASFDLSFVRAHAKRRVRYSNIHDTMIGEQILTAGWSLPYWDKKKNELRKRMPEYSLMALVQKHLGYKMDKEMQKSNWGDKELTDEQLKYAARDVAVMKPLYEIQCELLESNNLWQVAHLEFEALAGIIEMQFCGMPFSWQEAEKLREVKKQELAVALKELEKEARSNQKSKQMTLFGSDAGVDINFRSPAQITKYLKEKLGQNVDSSDVETLKMIDHTFCAKLLRYRTLEKQLNFIDQFESYGAKSGRLYPYYTQARAATGRMSSSRPNFQQVPKRGDGRIFRTLFRSQPGRKLVKVDFSAIEMRIMARLAMDPVMIKAITDGTDLHKLTAASTSDKSMEEVTKEDRQRAKAINFGLIYGASPKTLKQYAWMNYSVRMTEEEANYAHQKYFQLYKGIAKWHRDQKEAMKSARPYHQHSYEKGFYISYVTVQQSIMGRKRFWNSYAGESLAKPTEVFNMADQATGADITKKAMVELYKLLPEDVFLAGVVHDEIITDCPEEKAEEIKQLMLEVMCKVGSEMLNPVRVDAEGEVGIAWG